MNPWTKEKNKRIFKLLELYLQRVNETKGELLIDIEAYLLNTKECLDNIKAEKLKTCKSKEESEKIIDRFNKKIRINFKSKEYVTFFINTYKHTYDQLKPLIPSDRSLLDDISRYNENRLYGSVEDRKLDYYSILLGFNGFLDAKSYGFDILKKNTNDDFCKEKNLIDPEDPTVLILQALGNDGKPTDISQDIIKRLYKHIDSEFLNHNLTIKRFNLDQIINDLSNAIDKSYNYISHELYNVIYNLNSSLESQQNKVFAGEFSRLSKKNKKEALLKKRNYLKVYKYLSENETNFISSKYENELLKGFINIQLKNYSIATKDIEEYKNNSKGKEHYYFNNSNIANTILYKLYQITHDHQNKKKMENPSQLVTLNIIPLIINFRGILIRYNTISYSDIIFEKNYNPNDILLFKKNIYTFRKALKSIISFTAKTKNDSPVYYSFLAGLENLFIEDLNYKENVSENYLKAVNKRSLNTQDYIHLAYSFWELGTFEEVHKILDKTKIKRSDNKDSAKLILKTQAYLFLKNKEYDRALNCLKKTLLTK